MRKPLLENDPGIEAVSMHDLVGIANAIEQESVRRYSQLAELMDRRGEPGTAAAFRVMREEERHHVAAVEHWAATMGQPVPPAEAFEWQLPPDLSSSWEEIAGSALLTPYRAFALAVENEERAFAFYTYLAAHADDPKVMAEAEMLGKEELRHAALLRRFRRRAWHRERRPARLPDLVVASSKGLREVLVQHEAVIARRYRDLAARLRALGDEESAVLLEDMLAMSSAPAASSAVERAGMRDAGVARRLDPVAVAGGEGASALLAAWADGTAKDSEAEPGRGVGDMSHADGNGGVGGGGGGEDGSGVGGRGEDGVGVGAASPEATAAHLLIDAQKPMEALSETLEAIMRTTEGELFAEAAAAMDTVVTRLARISLQAAHRMQEQPVTE